jgi:hypothetical protein
MVRRLRSKNAEGREVIVDAAIDLQVFGTDGVAGIHPFLLPLMVHRALVTLRSRCYGLFCVGTQNVMCDCAEKNS